MYRHKGVNTNYRGTKEKNYNCQDDKTQKKKRTIVSEKEIKKKFPYVVPAQYEHRTAAVHKN